MSLFRDLKGGGLKGVSAVELRDAIGGTHVFTIWNDPRPYPTFAYEEHHRRFWEWFTDGRATGWPSGGSEGIDPAGIEIAKRRGFQIAGHALIERAERSGVEGADIRFSVEGDHSIRLGGTVLTAKQFAGFLASVTPGAGFVIEYRSSSGDEVQPVQWVEDEVLFPLGYDGRIVRKELESPR
jgi:hypothetical protein